MESEEYELNDEVKDLPEKVAEWFMQKPMSRERERKRRKLRAEG